MSTTDLLDDYDEIIHYDARNGYEVSLEAYLKHKPECINKLYQYGESKWTVLLAACYYQHEEIVQMLVTQFKADVEIDGTIVVERDDRSSTIIENVSPLCAAVISNNFNIVKFLVQYGSANVNHFTKDNITLVTAACVNGNLEMVQFLIQYGANLHQVIFNNYTNLMQVVHRHYTGLVTYFVDNIKCDLNQENGKGRTALHIAVERGTLEITKFLISRGALNLRDKSKNLTPLMWAAIHGKVDYVAAFDGHCSDVEWIEARELLGSAFAGCISEIEDRDLTVEYLTLALEARTTKNIPKQRSDQTSEVFNNRRECETLGDLNQLVLNGTREAFYIEALLIQERLLGTNNTSYYDSLSAIGNIFIDRNQYDISLRFWMYALNLRRQHKIPFKKDHLRLVVSIFDHLLLINKAQIFMSELYKLFTIMIDELSSPENDETFDYNLVTLLHLLTISAQLLLNESVEKEHKISMEDGKILIKHIRSIVHKNYITTKSGSSLLHLCCDENTEESIKIIKYPCLTTVRLLVGFGIDVDIMDSAKNTALHILVRNSQVDNSMAIIDFLCNNTSAHIDFADDNGNSPIEYPHGKPNRTCTKVRRLQQKMGVTSLKCRCARLAKYGRLPYKECLSSVLANFVYKH